jgi:hypothetical protein
MSVVPRVHIEGGAPGPLPVAPPATEPATGVTTEPAVTTRGP